MNETNTNEPTEPVPVEADIGRYLELLRVSEERKENLLRLNGEVARLKALHDQAAIDGRERIDNAEARVIIANWRERATRNKLVVTAQALASLASAVGLIGDVAMPLAVSDTVATSRREALELLELLRGENLL